MSNSLKDFARAGVVATVISAGAASVLALLPSDASAQAPSPTAASTVDRAVAAWAGVKSLRATFEQTVTNPLTGSAEKARGEYQQQGRNRLSVRFTDPAGDRIVADGTVLWLYLPSTTPGQVIRTKAGGDGPNVDFTAQFLDSPKTRYTITDAGRGTVDGRAARALLLVPKSRNGAPFSRAKVWVDDRDGLIRQFEVVDASGLTRLVRLTGLKVNGSVDAAAFRFVVPRGVRVVQQ